MKIAKKMHKEGLIYNLGWYTDLTKDKIIENIKEIWKIDNRQEIIKKL